MKLWEFEKLMRYKPDVSIISENGEVMCPKCSKFPANVDSKYGVLDCDICKKKNDDFIKNNPTKFGGYPDLVPRRIKEDRKKYFNSVLQPFRGGDLSKEYIEAYPEQTKKMVEDGTVTKEEVKKAKHVWKDLPGWSSRDKSK